MTDVSSVGLGRRPDKRTINSNDQISKLFGANETKILSDNEIKQSAKSKYELYTSSNTLALWQKGLRA